MATFDQLIDRIVERYEANRFDDALDELDRGAAGHPDHVASLVHVRACLLSLLGRPRDAVTTLRDGLDRGGWWAEPLLRDDPDLEAARTVDGFDAIATESAARWRRSFAGEVVKPLLAQPTGRRRAVLVVLQGGHRGTAEDVRDAWRAATDLGCVVVVPGRGQPISSDALDRRNWFDDAATDRAVATGVSRTWDLPLLLAGFSAGGRQALRLGFADAAGVRGLLLLAPAVGRSDPSPEEVGGAVRRGLRVCAWVGSEDPLVRDVTRRIEGLRAAGVVTTHEVIPGLGHRVPDDLARRLPGAIWFLLGDAPV